LAGQWVHAIGGLILQDVAIWISTQAGRRRFRQLLRETKNEVRRCSHSSSVVSRSTIENLVLGIWASASSSEVIGGGKTSSAACSSRQRGLGV
jgi:hypothetical protein